MPLLSPKTKNPREHPIAYRASRGVKEQLAERVKALGHSQNKVLDTALTLGLDLWAALEPEWEKIDVLAKERGESFAEAVLRLVRAGMAAGKKR